MGDTTLGDLLGAATERQKVEALRGLGIRPQIVRLLRENRVDLLHLCDWLAEGRNMLYRNVRLLDGFGPTRTQHVVEAIIRGKTGAG